MAAEEKGVLTPMARPETTTLVLPQRASIYIDVDGTVHFGALFEALVPVARSLGRVADEPETAAPHGESGE